MVSTDVYRLAVPMPYRVFVFGMMVMMSLVGVGFLMSALRTDPSDPRLTVILLSCGILVWNWIILLTIPHEIRFDSFDRVSFHSLARTLTLRAADIRSIKPYGIGGGFYLLRHNSGKIRLITQFTGFHEVVSRIKAANPMVEIIGI